LVFFDVRNLLSAFMVNDWPDTALFSKAVGSAIQSAKEKHRRIVICGECSPTLLAEGKTEATIQAERLWDEIVKIHSVETLCVYPSLPNQENSEWFQKICAEHTATFVR
jgi:hypothetical protein